MSRCSAARHEPSLEKQLRAVADSRRARAEPLYLLAMSHRLNGKHEDAVDVCERALRIPPPGNDELFVEPRAYHAGPLEELSISGYYSTDSERRRRARNACFTLLTDRDAEPRIRSTASQNAIYSLRPAAELFDDFPVRQLQPEIAPGYLPMNPSIVVDHGVPLCIVRSVNHRIAEDGSYQVTDADGIYRSTNQLLELNRNYEIVRATPIEDRAPGPPIHPFPILGFEDCRPFILHGRLWMSATVSDRNPRGTREIAVLELDDDRNVAAIHVQAGIRPGRHEKNWMPLVHDDELFFIYGLDPLTILRFDEPTRQAVPFKRERIAPFALDWFRGGSQALKVEGGWLAVTHEVAWRPQGTRVYSHRFVLLDEVFSFVTATDPFVFFAPGIEFCAGLARDPYSDLLMLGFGVGDGAAWLGFVEEEAVRRVLRESVMSRGEWAPSDAR
jgi:hypothetical protein